MKYYKILRDDMCHHNFCYKEGLNVDKNPFDSTPDCGGGLFFSDAKNILEFSNYGNLIAEVEVPEGELVVPVDTKYKSHRIILKNIRPLWNVETFKSLVEEGADVHADDDYALCLAARNGQLEIVKYLVQQGGDIHAYYDFALRWAAENGHLDVVKYLVECGADIHADCDYALRWATRNGHLDVVKYLIECGADIHAYGDFALRYAAENGNLDVVKYLVECGTNIHTKDDYAFVYGTKEVVEYLKSLNK